MLLNVSRLTAGFVISLVACIGLASSTVEVQTARGQESCRSSCGCDGELGDRIRRFNGTRVDGWYKIDKRHGAWTWYYDDEKKVRKRQEIYHNGQKDGVAMAWYENGILKSREVFRLGSRHGTAVFWYIEGGKRLEENYLDDQPDGPSTKWRRSGIPHVQEVFCLGELISLTRWHENGYPESRESYTAGRLDGLYQEWHDNGAQHIKGNYSAGKKVGVWKTWDADGALLSEMKHTPESE